MLTKTFATGFVAAVILAGCAMDGRSDLNTSDQAIKADTQVEILDVGYGGTTYLNGEKVILPEFIILFNFGHSTANIGGWYVSDGGNWGGDGAARFPQGTTIQAGDMLVIANYPPPTYFETSRGYQPITFEKAYGYAPDYEIGGAQMPGWSDPEIPDLTHVAGRIRLKHRQCTYDAECWDVQEDVMLIDGAHVSSQEMIELLETESVPEDLIVSTFPGEQ